MEIMLITNKYRKDMTEKQFIKTKLSRIMSLQAYKVLQSYVNKRYTTFIDTGKSHCIPSAKQFFSVSGKHQFYSRTLEKIVIHLLRDAGFIAKKIENSGRYIDKREVVTDTIGRTRIVGSAEYIPNKNVIRGMADIQAFGKGIYWEIEIKTTDRQSVEQKTHQKKVEQQGGKYSIIRSVDQFLNEFEKINNTNTTVT